jgi:hypothetical protein
MSSSNNNTKISEFLSVAGFSPDMEKYVRIADQDGDLALIHFKDFNCTHPLALTIRGWVYDTAEKKVVVTGEASYTDVMLTDKLMEEIDPNDLQHARQTTHVRLFMYKNKYFCSTNKCLDAGKSRWGIYNRSVLEMLLSSSGGKTLEELYDENTYNENEAIDLFVECVDNQVVVNDSIGEVQVAKVYNRADLLSFSVEHDEEIPFSMYDIQKDDIYWVDHTRMIRYLSPSMWNKMYTIRNPGEPNLLRRFYVLKGHGDKLLDVIPSDQQLWLREYKVKKNEMVQALVFGKNPPQEVLNSTNRIKTFFCLSGLVQYNLLFGGK